MMFHFHNFKKVLVTLAILGISFNIQMPANAQRVTRQQLDRLSLQELRILRGEQLRQANIVLESCRSSPYDAIRSTCRIMRSQYVNYFANLDNYIAQREILER
jgi:hypothetical protein